MNYYVIRYFKTEFHCVGKLCTRVEKIGSTKDIWTGEQVLLKDTTIGISIVGPFASVEAMNMHIRYPTRYPDGARAQAIVDAPFDLAGWEIFLNPIGGINDPDNAHWINTLPDTICMPTDCGIITPPRGTP